MSDIHDTLQRESERYTIRHAAFDRMTRRRDRKQRNQRIAALVVGLAIALGIVVVGSAMLRSAHEPQPGDRKHHSMLREGEVLEVADDGATLVATDTATRAHRTLACTDCTLLSGFALSAGGEWIAYSTAVGGTCNPGEGLWVVGEHRPPILATSACGSFVSNSAWSPRSEVLAFVDTRGTGSELALLDPATGERTTIVTNPWISALAWSPDGTQLAFAGDPSSGIRVVDLETGASTSIAPARKGIGGMAWSPDGMRLVFDEVVSGQSRIRVVNVDGSDDRILVDQRQNEGPGAPAWSPDGTRIAYVTTPRGPRGFSLEVWVIGTDRSDATRLFHGRCCIVDWDGPVWSPDGSRIAFLDFLEDIDPYPGTWRAAASDGTGSPEQIDEVVAESWAQGR